MALATWQNVAIALGRPSDSVTADQQAQLTYWLNGVELLIKSRLGPIADLDQDVVRYVETEVVAGKARPHLLNGGATSVTVTADDGTVTERYPSIKPADITGDLWAMFNNGTTSTAYTIGVVSPVDQA